MRTPGSSRKPSLTPMRIACSIICMVNHGRSRSSGIASKSVIWKSWNRLSGSGFIAGWIIVTRRRRNSAARKLRSSSA